MAGHPSGALCVAFLGISFADCADHSQATGGERFNFCSSTNVAFSLTEEVSICFRDHKLSEGQDLRFQDGPAAQLVTHLHEGVCFLQRKDSAWLGKKDFSKANVGMAVPCLSLLLAILSWGLSRIWRAWRGAKHWWVDINTESHKIK